jgi:hypothetical protein
MTDEGKLLIQAAMDALDRDLPVYYVDASGAEHLVSGIERRLPEAAGKSAPEYFLVTLADGSRVAVLDGAIFYSRS